MFLKIVTVFAIIAFANAGYLEPALRYAAPVPAISYQPAPLVSYTSPAITKTEFIPGSYSSSYRSDVITPRVKYIETPAISVAVPQPTIAVAPVARVAPFVPALPALAPEPLSVAGVGFAHDCLFILALKHVAPAPAIAYEAAPAISYAAPAIGKVEHLAPGVAQLYTNK
ncbi:hypothetical protein RN001_015293 [Aquatica leii]|uniref:Uncharacterized protein n=1 Tax=Aquatica leii TaxID=1421715 RepID=A0AAN7NZ11_9COLE|nr:hypothetical protein RN001_015293 [Aquatica leii]